MVILTGGFKVINAVCSKEIKFTEYWPTFMSRCFAAGILHVESLGIKKEKIHCDYNYLY